MLKDRQTRFCCAAVTESAVCLTFLTVGKCVIAEAGGAAASGCRSAAAIAHPVFHFVFSDFWLHSGALHSHPPPPETRRRHESFASRQSCLVAVFKLEPRNEKQKKETTTANTFQIRRTHRSSTAVRDENSC